MSDEAGGSFLLERRHALLIVARVRGLALELGFQIQLCIEVIRQRGVEGAFGEPEPAGRLAGEPLRQGPGRLQENPSGFEN
jgi:hypothetical protein